MRRKIKIHHVFISYSTRETEEAEAVRNILEKNRIACWMAPRDIPGGSNYTEEIPVAIQGCQVFLLILSENAQKSTLVSRELEAAVNCGKVIIPFMLEEFQLNNEFNFLLGAKHYGILFGVTQGGRDAFLFAVGGSYIAAIFFGPIGAYIGKLDGEKKVLSLREKKGIDPYLLYCTKCKKQFS